MYSGIGVSALKNIFIVKTPFTYGEIKRKVARLRATKIKITKKFFSKKVARKCATAFFRVEKTFSSMYNQTDERWFCENAVFKENGTQM